MTDTTTPAPWRPTQEQIDGVLDVLLDHDERIAREAAESSSVASQPEVSA